MMRYLRFHRNITKYLDFILVYVNVSGAGVIPMLFSDLKTRPPHILYEVNCMMSEHGSTAKQAGHPNIFRMDDSLAHFPHRPRTGMPHD